MKVEVVGKHEATFNGHRVRLRQVKLNTLKGGKWYIRYFSGHAELFKVKGQTYSDKRIYPNAGSGGKLVIDTLRRSYWPGAEFHHHIFLSDAGIKEVQHPMGAQLFEFDNASYNVLKEIARRGDYTAGNKLMGYPLRQGLVDPKPKAGKRFKRF